MLQGEPPRSEGDLNFRLLSIPVRVHPYFWLMAMLLGATSNLRTLLVWVAAVFIAVLFHELGHALAMRAYGFQPWIILHGVGGTTHCHPSPYARGSGTLGQVLISAAGPAAGFLLALALFAALRLAAVRVEFDSWLGIPIPKFAFESDLLRGFVRDLIFVNVVWGVFNLLPIYPLDGGQIAREIFARFLGRDGIRISLMLSMGLAGGLAAYNVYELAQIVRRLSSLGRLNWLDLIQNYNQPYMILLFGYLAYTSYSILRALSSGRAW